MQLVWLTQGPVGVYYQGERSIYFAQYTYEPTSTVMRKQDENFLEEHANERDDGYRVCKETGAEIKELAISRSVWREPHTGSGGDVRGVLHLFCTECNGEPDPRAIENLRGKGISASNLVSVTR